jgi:branched-subunit amino acid transport protein AzlD
MYIDLIVLVVLLLVVIMFFKRFSSFVFFIAIVDIFLRILAFIKNNIGLKDVAQIIGKYLPESVIDIIVKYTASIPLLCTILKWCFVGIMAIFLVYITKIFIHKKKI